MNEFTLIDHYFKSLPVKRKDVVFGIGDDAACMRVPDGYNLLVSTDTLVSGVHFLPEWDAYDIAYKALMVNISDMAAMAAQPCWVTLALTLPEVDQSWLASFSRALNDVLNRFNIDLIGGDTTHGPLSVTMTIMGVAPQGQSIRRSGAGAGDIILVSGELGAAAFAVKLLEDEDSTIHKRDKAALMDKLLHPRPRVDLTDILRKYATSAIDISDGLSADLYHICQASKAGACINKDAIPIHPLLNQYCPEWAVDLALGGGDDYELCFTVPAPQLNLLMHELKLMNQICYPIGVMEKNPGLRIKMTDSNVEELNPCGYSHF